MMQAYCIPVRYLKCLEICGKAGLEVHPRAVLAFPLYVYLSSFTITVDKQKSKKINKET